MMKYGLKSGGIIAALVKSETFFCLQLGYLLFGCSENTSKVLQAKDTTLRDAITAIAATQSFYKRQRSNEAYDSFYYRMLEKSSALEIGKPIVPRYRKPPKKFGGDTQHNFFQLFFCLFC